MRKARPKTFDIGPDLKDFEPYDAETWLFGFPGTDTGTIFDPWPRLVEEYGDDADPDAFDFARYELAIANACAKVTKRRLREVMGEATPEISLDGVGGKHRDAIFCTVTVTEETVRFFRRFILGSDRTATIEPGDADPRFAGYLEHHYSPRAGFAPYYSADPWDWICETRAFADFDRSASGYKKGHRLGQILKFVTVTHEDMRGDVAEPIDYYYARETDDIYPCTYYNPEQAEPALC